MLLIFAVLKVNMVATGWGSLVILTSTFIPLLDLSQKAVTMLW